MLHFVPNKPIHFMIKSDEITKKSQKNNLFLFVLLSHAFMVMVSQVNSEFKIHECHHLFDSKRFPIRFR